MVGLKTVCVHLSYIIRVIGTVLFKVHRASTPMGSISMAPATLPKMDVTYATAIMDMQAAQEWHVHHQVATCYADIGLWLFKTVELNQC